MFKQFLNQVRQEAVQQALAAMQSRPKPSLPMPSKRTSVMAKSPDRDRHDSDLLDSIVKYSNPEQSAEIPIVYDELRGTLSGADPANRELNAASSSDDDSLRGGDTQSTPERERPRGEAQVGNFHSTSSDELRLTQSPVEARPDTVVALFERNNAFSIVQKIAKKIFFNAYYSIVEVEMELALFGRLGVDIVFTYINTLRPICAFSKRRLALWLVRSLVTYSQPPDVTHNTGQARRITPADRVNRYNRSRQSSEDGMGTVTGTGRWKVSAKIQQLLNTLKRPKRRPLPEFYEDDDIELELAANPKDPNAPKPEGATMTPAIGEQLVVPSGLPRNLEAAIQRYGSATYKAPVATVLDPNGKLSITLTYGKLLSRSQKIAYTLLTKNFSKGGDTCSLKCGDRIALVYPNNDPINFMCAFYGCMFAGIVPVPIEVPITRRYSTDRDGSVMGVTVTRAAMLSNCRMLTMSCNYTEGENMVCVLDFKRETGLWHSILTSVLNGMHVVFIPYALMKVNPASWMQMITKYRASVAVVKSRDLHWGLLATKDHKDISLSSLRLLLVGDGANPWSLSSCDQFLAVFQAKGLRTDAICPSASSTECLTVSLRSFLSLVNRRLSPRRRCPPNGGFLSPSGGSRDDFLPPDGILGSSRSPRILSAFGPSLA
ncbi:unnamed protein product [Nesidiocoris tenuis]|uniref:AMP-dependent synthetase/ligase domain-containing protein n=1 Tax=Nesidiocoris tenuis TaxID=355587 RepID=A0A6H5H1F5_9HEMI|nr:unnamed protein product [Nesidiocoris tenuis]